MKIELNGKKIEGTLPKAMTLIGVGAVLALLSVVVIPLIGVVLGLVIFALAIGIPLVGWKVIAGKITEKLNFFPDEEGKFKPLESQLYESMCTDKILIIKCKAGNISVIGQDDYNKFSVKGDNLLYIEEDDCIQIKTDSSVTVSCPVSQRVSIFSGTGNITVDQLRELVLASGSGDVKVTNLGCELKAASGAGDFVISFRPDAQLGKVDIATASGNAEVILPPFAKVRFHTRMLTGELQTELLSVDNAPFDISFKAAHGNLTIR